MPLKEHIKKEGLCHFGRRAKLICPEGVVEVFHIAGGAVFIKRGRKRKGSFVHAFYQTVINNLDRLFALFLRSGIEQGDVGIFLHDGDYSGRYNKHPEQYQQGNSYGLVCRLSEYQRPCFV